MGWKDETQDQACKQKIKIKNEKKPLDSQNEMEMKVKRKLQAVAPKN